MKDLLKIQQWWVARFEPGTAPVQDECSNHYTMLPIKHYNYNEEPSSQEMVF